MSDLPKRIWASPTKDRVGRGVWSQPRLYGNCAEYLRADLLPGREELEEIIGSYKDADVFPALGTMFHERTIEGLADAILKRIGGEP